MIEAHLLRTLRVLFANTALKEEDSGGPSVLGGEEPRWGRGVTPAIHLVGPCEGDAPRGGPAPVQVSPVLDQAATADASFCGAQRGFRCVCIKVTNDLSGQILTLSAPLGV